MIPAQQTKFVKIAMPEALVDNASVATASIDLKGWDHAQIFVYLGTTDVALTALKVQESDDDGSSDAYADVPGLDFDGDEDIEGNAASLPAADDDDSLYVFDVDARKVERYVDLVATVGDGTTGAWVYAWAILSRGKEAPTTAAGRGAAAILRA